MPNSVISEAVLNYLKNRQTDTKWVIEQWVSNKWEKEGYKKLNIKLLFYIHKLNLILCSLTERPTDKRFLK